MQDLLLYEIDNEISKNEKLDSLDLGLFKSEMEPITPYPNGISDSPVHHKNKRKKTTKTKKLADGTEIILADQDDDDLPLTQSNAPYSRTYDETTNMLKASVYQIDGLQADLNEELKKIKASRTLKKKYDYMAEFGSTIASLVGTKITAIREMNSSITHGHDLEIKRMKDLKLSANEKDDDKQVMDMYNAFISTPMGNYNPLNAPSISEMTTINGPQNMVRADMVSTGDSQYDNYMNNLSPTQHMMLLESNPNVQTVIIYDQNTGNRWFDVQDITTGESIPNTDKPDEMLANDCVIDLNNNVARNTNLGISYPLVLVGGPVSEY